MIHFEKDDKTSSELKELYSTLKEAINNSESSLTEQVVIENIQEAQRKQYNYILERDALPKI